MQTFQVMRVKVADKFGRCEHVAVEAPDAWGARETVADMTGDKRGALMVKDADGKHIPVIEI